MVYCNPKTAHTSVPTPQTEFSSSSLLTTSPQSSPPCSIAIKKSSVSLVIGISCIGMFCYRLCRPECPLTYTTDRILIECCVLMQRPIIYRHSLWGIFSHRYLLLSVSLVSERRERPLPTPQQEFSSSFVSSPSVRPAPDTPYGVFFIIGISCYRYLLYPNPENAPYPHHSKNSPRVFYPQPASRQLQTLPMGHL